MLGWVQLWLSWGLDNKKIITEIVATRVIASRPPKWQLTAYSKYLHPHHNKKKLQFLPCLSGLVTTTINSPNLANCNLSSPRRNKFSRDGYKVVSHLSHIVNTTLTCLDMLWHVWVKMSPESQKVMSPQQLKLTKPIEVEGLIECNQVFWIRSFLGWPDPKAQSFDKWPWIKVSFIWLYTWPWTQPIINSSTALLSSLGMKKLE